MPAIVNQNNIQTSNTGFNQQNPLINNVLLSQKNKEIYSSFVTSKIPQNPTNKDRKHKKHSHPIKSIVSWTSGALLLLAGLDFLLGGKNIMKLRTKLSKDMISMEKIKSHRHYQKLNKLKFYATKYLNNTLGVLFSFDKIKDFVLMSMFNSMGSPGKFIVKASKSSLFITKKVSINTLYKRLDSSINSTADEIKKAVTDPEIFNKEEEAALMRKISVLFNGSAKSKSLKEFSYELVENTNRRTTKIENTIHEDIIKRYRKKYFPKDLTVKSFKDALSNWKKSLFESRETKDILRENWTQTEERFVTTINNTGINSGEVGNFGEARELLEKHAEELKLHLETNNCSDRFTSLAKQVIDINSKINDKECRSNPINFETSGEKFAGRVLDLSAGGGMSEIFIPPILGTVVAYQTVKHSEKDHRKEKFVKLGGPEIIGGILSWVITSNILSMSGSGGMLVGIAVATGLHFANKKYLKKIENANAKLSQS